MNALRFQSASQVLDVFPELGEDMVAEATDLEPMAFVAQLEASPVPEDAITFCAYVLDRRRAVWWALDCARQLGSPVSRDDDVALKTAEAWVRDPEEHRRLAALSIGVTGRRELIGTWVALAAGCSGGTMTLGDVPGPPVGPALCAKAARTAVLIGLSQVGVRDRAAQLTNCVRMFRTLAAGQAA